MSWNLFARTPAPDASLSRSFCEATEYHSRNYRLREENAALSTALAETQARQMAQRNEAQRWLAEMVEAQAMCGAGPWNPGGIASVEAHAARLYEAGVDLREAGPVGDVSPLGAYGMYELLLQNVNWQREINYSWLEFTRWGIQQIILICRLYYVKNPIPRRLVDVIAQYTFARGFDITTDDDAANELITEFIRRNSKVLGHVALTAQQRSKITDGNLFWVFFTDAGTGDCDLRIIDATEIQDIRTDPDDADVPQYYQRIWTQRIWSAEDGTAATASRKAWYPAIGFDPADRPPTLAGIPVMWESPVYHRKIGTVGKWLFGCPPMYPMVDWAKASRHFLEVCMSVRESLSQWATTLTTKGGQQAIEGAKQQMQTQVGPGSPIYDTNPAAGAGSTFISGPGTKLEAFKVQGATFSPEDVRRYLLMCCMTLGMPETFLGDVSIGNLATATSLDRPTETVFLSIQEEWIEDLTIIVSFMLSRSAKASNGKLREARGKNVRIVAAERQVAKTASGARYWGFREAKAAQGPKPIEVRVQFPAIREGDMATLVKAGVEAMTLDNKGGQVVGIDERAGILWVMRQMGIEDADELIEVMYPTSGKDKYNPDRAAQKLAAPIQKLQDQPGTPKTPAQAQSTVDDLPKTKAMEAVAAGFDRLKEAIGEHING